MALMKIVTTQTLSWEYTEKEIVIYSTPEIVLVGSNQCKYSCKD